MGFLRRLAYFAVGLAVLGVAALWMAVRASLPQLDGTREVAGLSAPVVVSRDALGVVTVSAADRRDAAMATGFVHAQERLFQMDLMRRLAAGELAELLGESAVGHDLAQRLHRMRRVARRVLDRAVPAERAVVEAYAAGVNAGADALSVRPFEYLILRARPAPWRPEDTALVVMSMYFRLHDERAAREARLARLAAALPPEMFAFLTQAGTRWDAPLEGEAVGPLPVPGPAVCDLRRVPRRPLAESLPGGIPGGISGEISGEISGGIFGHGQAAEVGSNAWAVSPTRTRDRVAMVANDMHLGLAMPNTWFRLRLEVADGDRPGVGMQVTGATLPGTPAVVAGSNGHLAWGLTNSYGDWVDLVELETDGAGRYRTPDGWRRFAEHRETIRVQGGGNRERLVRETIWGPVLESDGGDPPRALRWLAHDPAATNLALLGLETARDVEAGLAVAGTSGIPPQNLVLADSAGNIAWTIAGRMPRRGVYDPRLPASWAGADSAWNGYVHPGDHPRIVNPPSGAIWTANARVVDGDALALIGDGGYALGARAGQIRDALLALEGATEADMLRVQLDDRALFLARWRQLLLDVLDPAAGEQTPQRAAMHRRVTEGARRAAMDDAGYRLVRAFRAELADRVFAAIVHGCGGMAPRGVPSDLRQWEGALWRVVETRPPHLLAPGHEDWRAFLLAAADTAAASCGDGGLERCTWGEANGIHIRHPMSRAIPLLGGWLDLPAESLPGDTHMPRVQTPYMGASLRFAVAPGREASGYFHMPGGQSGHPLSPFYSAGHRAWAEGEETPFLPGPERHRLRLVPSG